MSVPSRARQSDYQDDSDEWLIEAARRAGHKLSRRQRPAGTSAWRMLLNAGLGEEEILKLACNASGTEAADISRVSPALNSFLPHSVALRYRVAPLGVRNGVLGVATYNPSSPVLERELAFASKHRVVLQAASPAVILRAQAAIYGTVYGTKAEDEPIVPSVPLPSRPAHVDRLSLAIPVPSEAQSQTPDLTDRLLTTAIAERASEVHLEPVLEGGLLVRLRVDGTLNDRFGISEANAQRVVQSLKTRAGMETDSTGSSQSGRASYNAPHGIVQLRVTTEPMVDGHAKMIIRLYAEQTALRLSSLGLSAGEQHKLGELIDQREGLVLVVGPAASGKTTTLYAIAKDLNEKGRSVITVEEPIERQLDGIPQTQVSDSPYPTFASAVRASLGTDVGAVLVGTLADEATMEVAIAGSREKHLVLSAIDTSDMASAVQLLYDLEPDLAAVSTSLKGIVAQRLLRKLCNACAVPQHLSELPEPQQRLLSGLPTAKLRRAAGCAKCRGTGYEGRTAIAEIVPMTPELQAAILRRADAPALALLARESGINNLWDSGMNSVVEGVTSLGELLDHVTPPLEVSDGTVAQQDIDALLAQLLGKPRPQPALAAAPVAAAAAAARPSARHRVLLVNDDARSRRALAKELSDAGFGVIEAADGAAGLAFARHLKPDVIVTEVALPRLDAVGLLEGLAADRTRPAVVVYTMQEDATLHAWLLEAGAAAVLPREPKADALVARIEELLAPTKPAAQRK